MGMQDTNNNHVIILNENRKDSKRVVSSGGWLVVIYEPCPDCPLTLQLTGLSTPPLHTDLTDNCSRSIRPVRGCADSCDQKCSSTPDQISNHRIVLSNPGSTDEKLGQAICHRSRAKPAVSEACLRSIPTKK